jgi:apoptosis-inducing factor 3
LLFEGFSEKDTAMMENEVFAARIDELQNGQMKEVTVGENKLVLAKVDDRFYAVGGNCPHLKAPLAKGALCGTQLYCPWHHSAFDITTGELQEPPALDCLPTYEVKVQGNEVYVTTISKQKVPNTNITLFPDKTFVIVGGGAAGLMAAQTLRQEGFDGKLVMITKEALPPYDRTMLSKKFLSGKMEAEKLPLRQEEFFEQHRIDLWTGKEVKTVDATTKTILLEDGSQLNYDKLLVATGGEPNSLQLPGANLENVCLLRSEADAERILEKAKAAKRVCIIGSSFIGLETAASLKTLGLDVTVLVKDAVPFEKIFGREIGQWFLDLHTEKGVTMKTATEVESIAGNAKVEHVVLKNGERIEADLVVVGIGVHPKTDFLQGVELDEKDGSVRVDEHLQAAADVYAAGDIARYPDGRRNEPIRVEHWRLAQQHGYITALNMLGKTCSVDDIVPFFWTNQYDQRLSYVGHAEDWDEVMMDGSVADKKFLAFYLKSGKVQALASMGRDVESNKIEDAMRRRKEAFTIDELKQLIQV